MSSNVFEYSVDHQLEPTRTAQGLALIHRFLQAELRMSGCLGVEGPTLVQAGETAIYNTRTRWKDVESFVVWVDSPQRRVLQEESQREG